MKYKVKKPTVSMSVDGKICNLTFQVDPTVLNDLMAMSGEFISLTIKEWREKRTLTQNAYFWVLLNQLAIKLKDSTANIYRSFIRDYGVREHILVKNEAVETIKDKWKKQGLGWFVEELRAGKIDNTTTLMLFYGSSTYNSNEMARLIDAVIDECEQQGIPTLTQQEFLGLYNENDSHARNH